MELSKEAQQGLPLHAPLEVKPEIGTRMTVRDQGTQPDAVVQLLREALESKVPVEHLERIVALHERVSDRAAAREFAEALNRFQELCPPIRHSKSVKVVTDDGRRGPEYSYAELPVVAKAIAPILKSVGLSYNWDTKITPGDKGAEAMLTVTCRLRHVNGHSEEASFTVPTTSRAGMSPAQKYGAAGTYAMRQSLIQVLGLTTAQTDNDGAAPDDPTPISAEQLADLRALLEECRVPEKRVLKTAKVDALEKVPAAIYDRICRGIREAAKAAK